MGENKSSADDIKPGRERVWYKFVDEGAGSEEAAHDTATCSYKDTDFSVAQARPPKVRLKRKAPAPEPNTTNLGDFYTFPDEKANPRPCCKVKRVGKSEVTEFAQDEVPDNWDDE